jgi:predicted metal-dependent enzyme (double-stranded beta helix superfamily)
MKEFYSSIENILLNNESLVSQLKLLRNLLIESLQSDEFRLNCLTALLNTIESSIAEEKSWDAPAIFYHEKLKFSVRLIFWPAFYENNPHEHKTWSLTGVFLNSLTVNTYDLLDNPTRLKRNRTFDAYTGEVGYLIPGCIHSVKNPSHELSGSIHIFNNVDISNPEDNAIWYPTPRKYNLSKGLIERALSVCLRSLSEINQIESFELIQRIYKIAPIHVKMLAIIAMYNFDRIYARKQFEKIELVL